MKNKHPNHATVHLETWRQQPIQVEEVQPNYEQPVPNAGDKQPFHQQLIQEHENLKHDIVTLIKEKDCKDQEKTEVKNISPQQ